MQLKTTKCGDDSHQSQTAVLESKTVGRRTFLQSGLFAVAAVLLRSSRGFDTFIKAAQAASIGLVHDTLNGLLAFVVPGPDLYSVGQGVSTAGPGGVDAEVTEVLIGCFRFGPAGRSKPGWARELPQSTLFPQISGVGGTTNHYQGNSPRAMPGVFLGYEGSDRSAYDTAHLFPFGCHELRPYYEWVEETLPVQTAPMGTKEEAFFRGASW